MGNLAEFMSSPQSNTWLNLDNMSVYIRKGHHAFNGEIIATFDIANVSVPSKYQNQGTFTRFLEDVESLGLPVYIENVLTPRFADFFRKRGYDTVSTYGEVVSFLSADLDKRIVSLGDLYADECVVCGARAEWGIASKSGPEGCVEAIETGRTYCKEDLPVVFEKTRKFVHAKSLIKHKT